MNVLLRSSNLRMLQQHSWYEGNLMLKSFYHNITPDEIMTAVELKEHRRLETHEWHYFEIYRRLALESSITNIVFQL